MFFIALFVLVLFALAAIFVWLAENPGAVTVEWPWLGSIIEVSLLQAMIVIVVLGFLITLGWMLVWGVLNSPKSFGRWRSGRRRDKGYGALSRGLVAAGAGDAPLARKLTKESSKLLDNEPLVALLDAQTALLEGNKGEARSKFETMLKSEDTKLLGLRGLYVEAEQEGAGEAAAHFAKEANKLAPGTPWASKAVLKAQTIEGDWEAALRTLGVNNAAGLVSKDEFKRKRAVLLTALAMEEEAATPERAKGNGLAAHKLAPDLVPAALVAARAAKRLGDPRKASKVLEASWKLAPHPEVAEEYIAVRSGDSAQERLKRAQALSKKQPDHFESHFIVAKAALDTGDFKTARDAMEQAMKSKPTERACLLMADIEEAEHGDKGRVREWLSRAVTAERDSTWTADGIARETWAPFSPVTGKLDAFEWKIPMEQLGGASLTTDYSHLVHEPLPKPEENTNEDIGETSTLDETIEDAEVVDVVPAKVETTESTTVEIDVKANKKTAEKAETVDETDSKIERTVEAVSVGGSVGAVAAGAAGVAVAAISEEVSSLNDNDASSSIKKEADEATENKSGDEKDKADDEASKSPPTSTSPFRNANLDEDQDGVIDHRPDDPGVDEGTSQKKKGLFF